jgi:peptide/nickel transport system substrate-binding protein
MPDPRDAQERLVITRRGLVLSGAAAAALAIANPRFVNAASGTATPSAGSGGSPVASSVASDVIIRSTSRADAADATNRTYPIEKVKRKGGRLRVGGYTDISTTNPLLAVEGTTVSILGLVFEPLVGVSPIDGQPIPGLADSWEIAADKVTYTFHLNPDVVWHDGASLTAADVVFTFERVVDPSLGSPYGSYLTTIIKQVHSVGAHTVKFIATGERSDVLSTLNITPILPEHLWKATAVAEWVTDAGSTGQDPSRVIGTGPFRFSEWVPGDHVTLIRNKTYWDLVSSRVPVIDAVEFHPFADNAAKVQALIDGSIDLVDQLSADQLEQVKTTKGLTVKTYDTLDFTAYAYNLDPDRTTLFQDKRVRQALYVGLDRTNLTRSIYHGIGAAPTSTQPPGSFANVPDQMTTTYPYSRNHARQLLKQAGWVDSDGDGILDKDGQPFASPFSIRREARATKHWRKRCRPPGPRSAWP